MACYQWASYASTESVGCLDIALLQNTWVTQDQLAAMNEELKKSLLIERLNLGLSHSVVDLSVREVSASQGGLCGLAAIHQALEGTLLTKSQLRTLEYKQMVAVMVEEMGMSETALRDTPDVEVLMYFYDCEFTKLELTTVNIIFQGHVLMDGRRFSDTTSQEECLLTRMKLPLKTHWIVPPPSTPSLTRWT